METFHDRGILNFKSTIMGRSVNYHSDSRAVIYIPTDEIDFDELSYLVDGIRDIAPSFQ